MEMRRVQVARGEGAELGWFHKWTEYAEPIGPSAMVGGYPGGQMKYDLALVELDSGEVIQVVPDRIKFLERPRCEEEQHGPAN